MTWHTWETANGDFLLIMLQRTTNVDESKFLQRWNTAFNDIIMTWHTWETADGFATLDGCSNERTSEWLDIRKILRHQLSTDELHTTVRRMHYEYLHFSLVHGFPSVSHIFFLRWCDDDAVRIPDDVLMNSTQLLLPAYPKWILRVNLSTLNFLLLLMDKGTLHTWFLVLYSVSTSWNLRVSSLFVFLMRPSRDKRIYSLRERLRYTACCLL